MFSTHIEAPKYAQAGWPVFPLHPYSKKPKTPDGFKSASTDPATVSRWWREDLMANIGLHCRDFIVLDVDGSEGRRSLADLELQNGPLPDTLRQRTPGDGTHYIFRKPIGLSVPNSAGKLGKGLDVRSQDGYIVIAPSTHPETCTSYTWDTMDGEAVGHYIAECPPWLVDLAVATPCKRVVNVRSENGSEIEIIPEGQRHDRMMREAGINARRFREDPDLVLGIMRRLNETRCDPPLPQDELDAVVVAAIEYAAVDEPEPVIKITHASQVLAAFIGTGIARNDYPAELSVSDQPAVVVPDFSDGLRLNRMGTLKPNTYNAVHLLNNDPDWVNAVCLDTFQANLVFSRDVPRLNAKHGDKVLDEHITQLAYELQADTAAEFASSTIVDSLLVVGRGRAIHPVREYLAALEWDQHPRIDTWLIDYLGAPDTALTRAFGARWLIAAVARVMDPGCKVDTCLILEGKEGIKKSTTLKELVPDPKWFTDSVGDLNNKDTLIALRGKWIIEMGELTALSRSEVESAKAFISRTTDTYRGPYGRVAQDWDRQFVLSGSTNRSDYLQDAAGNRRFWPVPCTEVSSANITSDRDQFWAEAVARYRAGEKWWVHEEELVRDAACAVAARVVGHPWQETIASHAAREAAGAEITTEWVLSLWIGKDKAQQTNGDAQRVGRILTDLGWTKDRRRLPDGQQYRLYRKTGQQ